MNLLGSIDGVLLAVGAVFVLVLFVIVWVGIGVTRAREDMTYRLALYGRDQPASGARDEELAKPLAQRTVGPLFLRFSNFLRRFTPAGYLEKIEHKLMLGGDPGNLDAPAFVVIKLLTTVLGLLAAFQLVDFGADTIQRVALFGLPIAMGFFGPTAWLQRKVDDRRQAMLRALPDLLDLLVISVEAGLGFDSALARVIATVPGPLSEEFFRMLQETRV
ncbi:MAG: hypothetical protein V3U46_01045, partial [Acidimicrobiia bacterium]